MKVIVKLFAVLRVGRFKEKSLDYPDGTTIEDVIQNLELPTEHVDILLLNGVHAERECSLQDGDTLSVLPMVEGG